VLFTRVTAASRHLYLSILTEPSKDASAYVPDLTKSTRRPQVPHPTPSNPRRSSHTPVLKCSQKVLQPHLVGAPKSPLNLPTRGSRARIAKSHALPESSVDGQFRRIRPLQKRDTTSKPAYVTPTKTRSSCSSSTDRCRENSLASLLGAPWLWLLSVHPLQWLHP
jgi:hypothetical protein